MLYPFTFEQNLTQNYLWGGKKLTKLGYTASENDPLAEAWLLSDRPQDNRVSVVKNGRFKGKSLSWLSKNFGQELLGYPPINDSFPLLIKILDAKKRLSLQVHPPSKIAHRLNGEPKNECWYFLAETEKTAQVFAGFNKKLTAREFSSAVKAGDLESLLHTLPAQPGKLLYLPSGRIHAINAGCFILEIQQNSNTTYRVHDWNRLDPKTKKPRELHLAQALKSINFNDLLPDYSQRANSTLLSTENFSIKEYFGNSSLNLTESQVIIGINSSLTINWGRQHLTVRRLEPALIPINLKVRVKAETKAKWLSIRIPGVV